MARKHKKQSAPPTGNRHPKSTAPRNDPAKQAAARAVQVAVGQLNSSDVHGAVRTIAKGLQAVPDHPDLLHLGGQAALYLGDLQKGKELIRRAIKIAP